MEKFKDGDRIELLDANMRPQSIFGSVVGTATYLRYGHPTTQLVILLDQGFYNPNSTIYVGTLLVHPDNCVKVVDAPSTIR